MRFLRCGLDDAITVLEGFFTTCLTDVTCLTALPLLQEHAIILLVLYIL